MYLEWLLFYHYCAIWYHNWYSQVARSPSGDWGSSWFNFMWSPPPHCRRYMNISYWHVFTTLYLCKLMLAILSISHYGFDKQKMSIKILCVCVGSWTYWFDSLGRKLRTAKISFKKPKGLILWNWKKRKRKKEKKEKIDWNFKASNLLIDFFIFIFL